MLFEIFIENVGNISILTSLLLLFWFHFFSNETRLFFPFNIILISEFSILIIFGHSDYFNDYLIFLGFFLSLIIFLVNGNKKHIKLDVEGIVNSFIINYSLEGYLKFIGVILFFTVFFIDYNNKIWSDRGLILLILSLILIALDFFDLNLKKNYKFEIDFVVIFLLNLFILLCFYSIISMEEQYGDKYDFFRSDKQIEYLLAAPLSKLLNLAGIYSWSDGRLVYYPDLTKNLTSAVDITRGCSGLYSIFVFLSCFISYLIASFRTVNLWIISSGIIAIAMSYTANLIRMFMIVLVGHYYGGDALIWTHKNIGWLIFSFWFLIFWYFFSNFIENDSDN